MTKILALTAKKQGGKNTAFNFILAIEMLRLGIVRGNATITDKGKLYVDDIFGDKEFAGIFDVDRHNQVMDRFLEEHIYPFVKNYSFADNLKRKVCMDVLGLSHEQCFGTDEQKNSLTHLKWENMPGVTTEVTPSDPIDKEISGRLGKYYEKCLSGLVYHKPGPMTAREVMQFVGTDIFRKMYGDVWAESTIRTIQKEGSEFAIITDCRFPNEVDVVKRSGGKVVRFTRGPASSKDLHASEIALDKDKYDWQKFDAVIDNADMTIAQQNEALHDKLLEWGFWEKIDTTE